MNGNNNMIAFWRVVFTFSIAIHHLCNTYSIATYWMIGVEFFFIVSGWLLAEKADTSDITAFDYTYYRIKRLYPQYITAFIVCVLCMRLSSMWNISNQFQIDNTWEWFTEYGFKEVFIIHFWPWGTEWWNIANIPTWYISVMLFCGLILFSLFKNYKMALCQIIIPISAVTFYTISYKLYHNFTEDEYIYGIISLKMLRGFTEMGIGILLHEFNKSINKRGGARIQNIKNALGIICLTTVFILSYSYGEQFNYIYIILISFGVLCSFECKIKYGSGIIIFLSSLSYSIYLNHNVIRLYIMPYLFKEINIWNKMLYLVLVVSFAYIMSLFTNELLKWLKRIVFTIVWR